MLAKILNGIFFLDLIRFDSEHLFYLLHFHRLKTCILYVLTEYLLEIILFEGIGGSRGGGYGGCNPPPPYTIQK